MAHNHQHASSNLVLRIQMKHLRPGIYKWSKKPASKVRDRKEQEYQKRRLKLRRINRWALACAGAGDPESAGYDPDLDYDLFSWDIQCGDH